MTLETFLTEWHSPDPTIEVKTSGSTGIPKVMRVEKARMEASARKTIVALGLKAGDKALLCMPLDFIAGKMMVVRAIVGGMKLIAVEPSSHPLRTLTEIPDFVAMVPMQVYNSLQSPAERNILERIPHIIIGGGAIDEDLERELSSFGNNIYSTYGMTETLSHIALRRLSRQSSEEINDDFGRDSDYHKDIVCDDDKLTSDCCNIVCDDDKHWYTPLDNVSVSLSADSCLIIDAPDVCAERLITNDIARIHPDGKRFRIVGRRDNVICSGGIKIQIEEVESLLRNRIHRPFLITRGTDPILGEATIMLVEKTNQSKTNDDGAILDICRRVLPKYHCPRHIFAVDHLPLTATGKPARKEAEQIAKERLAE